jgi:hypothetical protein
MHRPIFAPSSLVFDRAANTAKKAGPYRRGKLDALKGHDFSHAANATKKAGL